MTAGFLGFFGLLTTTALAGVLVFVGWLFVGWAFVRLAWAGGSGGAFGLATAATTAGLRGSEGAFRATFDGFVATGWFRLAMAATGFAV